jgi:hypothetical protein
MTTTIQSPLSGKAREQRLNQLLERLDLRKLRSDLTPDQRAQAKRVGDLSFRSHCDPFCRKMSIRVKYAGVGPKGQAGVRG